jgi:tetratricopeptide (TPR) repeat protein
MHSPGDLPATFINCAYFDLECKKNVPLHTIKIEFSFQNLVKNIPLSDSLQMNNPITIVHPISFRQSLVHEFSLSQYQVTNPLQVKNDWRSQRYSEMCDYLTHYEHLESKNKLQVIELLSSLCFHDAILEYIPVMSGSEIAQDSTLASLANCRAMSNLLSSSPINASESTKEFELIAAHAPLGSKVRFSAAIQLISLAAKNFGNLKDTEHWQNLACQELKYLKDFLDDFTYKHLTDIYYRAAVFVSILKGERKAAVEEMDLCEALAKELTQESKTEVERIAAHENLTTVFESRTKEALWLKDFDLAEERARKLVEMDPLYPRYRLQLGEILIKQSKIEEALMMYRSAARLGPPGTAIAWFMAGQCHEKLENLELACDCYLASVKLDSLAISAIERLTKLSPQLGNPALAYWSTIRFAELQVRQRQIASQPRNTYIPEASSGLKVQAEETLSRVLSTT